MGIFERFSIKQQLVFGFVIMAILLAVIVLSTIFQLNKTTERSQIIAELRAPTAFTTATMRKGIVHALAALRGWMILGEDKFKTEREDAWTTEINPQLKTLQNLSINWTVPENVKRLAKIEKLVIEFSTFQQQIESVVHTPSNRPAHKILFEEVTPEIQLITDILQQMIVLENKQEVTAQTQESLLLLTSLHGSTSYVLADLTEYILVADKSFKHAYQQHWAQNQISYDKLSSLFASLNKEQQAEFAQMTAARERLKQLIPSMIAQRESLDWDLANHWLATKAAPVGAEIEELLTAMQRSQERLLVTDNTVLTSSLTNQINFSWFLLFLGALAAFLFAYILRLMLNLFAELNHSVNILSLGEDINANANANANNLINRSDEFGLIARSVAKLNDYLVETGEHARQISTGNYDVDIILRSKNDVLGQAMLSMKNDLASLDQANKEISWLQQGRVAVVDVLSQEQAAEKTGDNVLTTLCAYVGAHIGSLYQWQENGDQQGTFHQIAAYAYTTNTNIKKDYHLGEGLIGQAAEEDKIVTINDVPDNYIQVQSSLGQSVPQNLILIPFSYLGNVHGVLEIGFIDEITATSIELFETIREPLALAFEGIVSRASIEQGIIKSKALAEKISRNEKRTRTIIEASISGIITITQQGLIQSFNSSAERLFGYSEGEVLNKNVSMLMPAPRSQEHDSYLRNFLQTGIAQVIGSGREVIALRKDGSEFHMHLSVAEMNLDDEHLFLGTVTDITEEVIARENMKTANEELELSKQQIEQALARTQALTHDMARNEERTRTIVDSSIAGIITITPKGLVQSFNASAERLFGYTLDEVMNKNVSMLMPASRAVQHDGYLDNFLQTGIAKIIGSGREVVALHKDGTEFHIHLSIAEMNLEDEQLFLGMVTDITDEVMARQRIVEANDELQANSEELQSQQEELRVTNEELTLKGEDLEKTRKETELKAEELAEASRYKSEFLANMSHELRTPLNSLLILSNSLAENEDNNLSEDEVESATVVRDSGKHLLELINEILDLSKVEAGKMTAENQLISFSVLSIALKSRFDHMAKEKGVGFSITIAEDLPAEFVSDETKLNQILTNLISNGLKFTSKGKVNLKIESIESSSIIDGHDKLLAFSVTDTGIGIEEEQQSAVFEAFQQADGSTSRQYGGTGLGLSIVSSFVELLGGQIKIDSKVGKGSTFTVYLPFNLLMNKAVTVATEPVSYEIKHTPPPFKDDRENIDPEQPLFLIIEDDEHFAKILYETCHQQETQALVAPDGETGISLANDYKVTGIILDYMLPGMDGSDVLAVLNGSSTTRHIPVHIISAVDELMDLYSFGVIGQLTKPVTKTQISTVLEQLNSIHSSTEVKLLLVEDDKSSVKALRKLLESDHVSITAAHTGQEAISLVAEQKFTAMIIDLGLPDMTGFELLETLMKDEEILLPPVIVHTGKELSDTEHQQLREITDSIVIKSVASPARLQDEVHLFIDAMIHSKSNAVIDVSEAESIKLAGNVVLLVDDDMRNTFALAKVLRKKELIVHIASSGKDALEALDKHDDINVVLMDIMMPEMDGYEAMGKIRQQKKFSDLPIIALTAKAMTGDKEKCLAAGASDYLTKPVDVQKLLVMMQVWL